MSSRLLKKGLEIEIYAGTQEGNVLPLSKELKTKFPFISQEPDQRNFEYITPATPYYEKLFKSLIIPRLKIRDYLKKEGDYTLIPFSTIPLEYSKKFYPAKPNDPYCNMVQKKYKTKVVTTSIHINIGINSHRNLFKLLPILRLYVPLFLGLSASSAFHNGENTGFQSFRWHNFPKTPKLVPYFTDHTSYINWTNKKLSKKEMFNVRHLWSSIRPNGPDRPYKLNRIEIRICDFISDPCKVLAVMALIECLCHKYLSEDNSPLILKSNLEKLQKITDLQEEKVAKYGLEAKIWDWRKDQVIKITDFIEDVYKENLKTAKMLNINNFLTPIMKILEEGNEASRHIKMYRKTADIKKTVKHFTEEFTLLDLSLAKGYH